MIIKEAYLTDWYEPETDPIREGVYEMKTLGILRAFRYWDGEQWFFYSKTPDEAYENFKFKHRSSVSLISWRGITFDANGL